MKSTIFVAILLLALLLMLPTLALQSMVQSSKVSPCTACADYRIELCNSSTYSSAPGSGGGGEGVI